MREQPQFEIAGDFAARVLKQGREVIGGRAEHGVLEVDEAEPLQPVAFGEPMQIGRVEVAKRPCRPRPEDGGQEFSPKREELHPCADAGCSAITGAYQSSASSTSIDIASIS